MFFRDIPASLAKEKTRERIYSQALGKIVVTKLSDVEKALSDNEVDDIEKVIEAEIAKKNRLQLVYVGDYLEEVDKAINMSLTLTIDVLFGKGSAALDIIKELHTVPDYSEYASGRPPRNGTPSNKDKTTFWVNPALQ